MVMQRQVPARPVAKAGGGAEGGNTGANPANDTFSTVLSGETRGATAGRDKIDSRHERDRSPESTNATVNPEAAGDEPVSMASSETDQSEEMLALLAGLKSSAAFSDEAELGVGAEETGELTEQERSGRSVADPDGEEALSA